MNREREDGALMRRYESFADMDPTTGSTALPAWRRLLSGFFGLCGAASFFCISVAMLFFQDALDYGGKAWIVVVMFGAVFLFIGLSVAVSSSPFGLMFAGIGSAICAVAGWYGMADPAARDALLEEAVPILILAAFVIVGLCFLIVPEAVWRKKAERYTKRVSGTVVDKEMREHRDSDGRWHRSYYLTWEYYAGGTWRRWQSGTGRSPEPREVGYVGDLFLDPRDPDDCWEKPQAAEKAIFRIMGIIFTAVGLLAMGIFLFAGMI